MAQPNITEYYFLRPVKEDAPKLNDVQRGALDREEYSNYEEARKGKEHKEKLYGVRLSVEQAIRP
jgi:hypothetical protein